MNPLVLAIVGSLLGIAVVCLVLAVAGNFGNRRANAARERMKAATPYTPPANSRPNDFDSHGRSW